MATTVQECVFTKTFSEISRVEDISGDRLAATLVCDCEWADRIQLYSEFLGYIEDRGGNLVFHKAHRLSDISGWLIATRATCRGIGKVSPHASISNLGKYERARLDVHYETVEFSSPEQGAETYITESLEPAAEFLTLSRKGLYFGTGGSKVSLEAAEIEPPAMVVRMTEWVYTIHKLLTLPAVMSTLPGQVNNAPVYSRALNRWFATETLLCGDPEMNREISSIGISAWTVTFRFLHRPQGWNNYPRTDTPNADGTVPFVPITDGTNPLKFYPPASFATLIL